MEPGRAVLSIAGRDAGRRLIVLKVDGDYAYTADGDLRKTESPKRKKSKHLRTTIEFFPSIAETVQEGKVPTNAEIRKHLKTDRQGRI